MGKFRKNLRVASCNMMSLPRQDKTVHLTVESSTGRLIELVGWQECDNPVYRNAIRDHAKGYATVFAGTNVNFNSPVSYRPDDWGRLDSGSAKIYDGVGGISHTRHLEWVKYRSAHDKSVEIVHINIHSVVVKASSRLQRLRMRRQAKAALNKVVSRFMQAGLPIVITGDFNDRSDWFPFRLQLGGKVRRAQTVTNARGIDKATFINGAKYGWRILGKTSRNTPSDHDTLVVDVHIYEK